MPFQVVREDITKIKVKAIVNPAEKMPGYGPGVDEAIYRAAGAKDLLEERRQIGVIRPGAAAITYAGRLPARHIIHTVGIPWKDGENGEEEILRECYRSSLLLASVHDIDSIAFPLLGSGNFGFPKGLALRIALSEFTHFLSEHEMDIYLVVYDRESVDVSQQEYGDIEAFIDDHYVEEQEINIVMAADDRRPFHQIWDSRKGAGKRHVLKETAGMSLPDREDLAEESVTFDALETLDQLLQKPGKTFMEMVFTYADRKGLTDVQIQKKANLDRKAFSKLKCGITKKPSKPTALAFAIALELNIDEAKDLLKSAGYAFAPSSKQDIIVEYFIERQAYDIHMVNVVLFEHGEGLLGCQAV